MKTYAISFAVFFGSLAFAPAAFAEDPPALGDGAPPSDPTADTGASPIATERAPMLSLRAPVVAAYAAPGRRDAPDDDAPSYVPSPANVYFRFGLGVRATYAPNEGLDPFTATDTIGQASFEVSRTLFARGRTSLAIGVGWDVGAKRTKARGVDSDLTHHRILVPIEGRFHLASWLYGFAKVAPGASLLALAAADPSAPTPLSDLRPGFALDASAGASFLLVGHGPSDHKKVRLWATPELGYGWTTSARPTLSTDTRDDVLGREAGASMAPVAVRGFFFRIGLGLTY